MRIRSLANLIVCAFVAALVACDEQPSPSAPTPSRPAPVTVVTAPVQGQVRTDDGVPLEQVRVSIYGAAYGPTTSTDAAGRFFVPSMTFSTVSPRPWVGMAFYLPGYVGPPELVPMAAERTGEPAQRAVTMRTVTALIEDRPYNDTVTNADPDVGSDADKALGLPGARGPVKSILVQPRTDGPVQVRAEWDGPDALQMWIERRYLELSIEATRGPGNVLTIDVPAGWGDPLNQSVLTIGLLRESRASGGLSGPVPIRVTLTPLR